MGGGARAGCYAGHGTRVTGHTAPSALAPRVPRPRPSAPRQAIYLDTPISTSVTLSDTEHGVTDPRHLHTYSNQSCV